MKKTTDTPPISREYDNLFVYRKGKPYDTLENNEFLVKRLSSEAEALSEKSAQAEANKENTPWPAHLLYAVLLLLLLPIQWLIETLLPGVHYDPWGKIIYCGIIFIFLIIAVMVGRKFKPSDKQRAIMLAASNAAIRAELGIPEAAREIDVLPYIYKKTKKGLIPNRKDGRFDNIPVCIWRVGDDLCLSDDDAVIRFSIKAIREIREVQKKCHISTWYKSHAYNSKPCKPFIKENTWQGLDILSYIEVEIMGENGIRYLLIPSYDARAFRELVDPTRPA